MNVIFILIGLSLVVALTFLYLFVWSVKDGQYDDDVTPGMRMLFDENPTPEDKTDTEKKSTSDKSN